MPSIQSSHTILLRYVLCDNFYLRHVLARQILKFTDNEVCMIGTVRFNLVDSVNCPMLEKAISQILDRGREAWCLFAACDGVPNLSEL